MGKKGSEGSEGHGNAQAKSEVPKVSPLAGTRKTNYQETLDILTQPDLVASEHVPDLHLVGDEHPGSNETAPGQDASWTETQLRCNRGANMPMCIPTSPQRPPVFRPPSRPHPGDRRFRGTGA
jgi:hypothetical protein